MISSKDVKRKRSPNYNATDDYVKLESFKNYVIESSLDDLWVSFVQMYLMLWIESP